MPGTQRVQWDIWYWFQDVMNELLLPPEEHGWTTAGLMMSTMIISMIVYDCIMFLMDMASLNSNNEGNVTTTIMGGRRRNRLSSPQDLLGYR